MKKKVVVEVTKAYVGMFGIIIIIIILGKCSNHAKD